MSPEQFNALVERLSAAAARHPQWYRLQVLGLVVLGYLYLGGVVVVALALSLGLVALCIFKPILLVKLVKIIWAPIWLTWSILRALWVRFEPPTGIELRRAETPRLFDELDRLRSQMGAPLAHHVLLTDEYNAGVVQIPRLGVLGWPRNYLMIGLPLMAGMSPDQFRAVLAHEFGHLCAGDSRMGGRIYQQRVMWGRLQEQFAQRGSWVFKPFISRFAPWFNAYSFVMARAQEYAADRAAAAFVGPQAAGQALVLSGLGAEYQSQRIWKPLWDRMQVEEQPTQRPYLRLLSDGAAVHAWSEAQSQLQTSLKRDTDWSDTHPSLRDRLAAIQVAAQLPVPAGESAAQAFLGDRAPRLAGDLDRAWQQRVEAGWRERYRQAQAHREQLAGLEQTQLQGGTLDTEQRWQLAALTEQVRDSASALPLYRAYHAERPEDPRGQFALGRVLLEQDDEAGLALLDRAMQLDGDAIKPAAELAYHFLMKHERGDAAAKYESAWTERNTLEQLAAQERAEFTYKDRYEPHGLAEPQVAAIRAALRSLDFVKSAWLVRKAVRHFPERPALLLFVHRRSLRFISAAKATEQLSQALGADCGITIAVYDSDFAKLWKAVKKVDSGAISLD